MIPETSPLDSFMIFNLCDNLNMLSLFTQNLTNGSHTISTSDERSEDNINLQE